MNLPYYDLQKSDELKAVLRDLWGFWKLWSACLLSDSGLPTLRGVSVTRSYSRMRADLQRFLSDMGQPVALIRHDKCPEAPPTPRGGFLVGERRLEETIRFFFEIDRIVAVYEMADPLLNSHNMNVLFESEGAATVEVLGPGFDASDLQRGDLSPHEAFSVSMAPDGAVSEIRLVHRIDQSSYAESLRARNEKIKKKLASSPSEALARRIGEDLGFPKDLEAHLKAIGSPLYGPQGYQPVPEQLVRETVTSIIRSQVVGRYREVTGVGFPLVFSTSLVNRGQKQVFWDIVSPALKFEGLESAERARNPWFRRD